MTTATEHGSFSIEEVKAFYKLLGLESEEQREEFLQQMCFYTDDYQSSDLSTPVRPVQITFEPF